jgi:hypothetical protein
MVEIMGTRAAPLLERYFRIRMAAKLSAMDSLMLNRGAVVNRNCSQKRFCCK